MVNGGLWLWGAKGGKDTVLWHLRKKDKGRKVKRAWTMKGLIYVWGGKPRAMPQAEIVCPVGAWRTTSY